MEYRAVGNRCAVNLDSLHLPIAQEQTLTILRDKGFRILEVNIVVLARQCIGSSQYCRGAKLSEAPAILDCSSFVKWLYGMRGIWLPRRSIQQLGTGETVSLHDLIAGDVVFVSGWINYFHDDPASGVGHVGIVTDNGTIIHAADSKVNVVESPLNRFIGQSKFRGARRYIPKDLGFLTLETPKGREIETADDIKWVVLQSLPYPKSP